MIRNATLVLCGLACFMAGPLPASAQTSPQFQACNKAAKTQLDLDKCAGGELSLRNNQMQSVYSAVLARVARQPAALAKVKAMQRAWLAYASAYLDALYPAPNKQAEYGSIYPMEAGLARAGLVQSQTAALKGLLSNFTRH